MNNIEKAKERLKNGASLVLYDGKEFIEENGKGLSPLLKLLSEKNDLSRFCAADKIIGKAAALLFALLKIKNVYGEVLSRKADTRKIRYKVFFRHRNRQHKKQIWHGDLSDGANR